MKQLTSFIKKEFMEGIRTGKLYLVFLFFFLFGVMNPGLAKLTPWLMKMASDDLAEQGIVIQEVPVDAMTSWIQFNKNALMIFVIFLLMICSILTSEYQKGTLINILTKGMARWKVILSKFIYVFLLWTAGYWMCYGVTYGYNAYYWDNRIAEHLAFYALCLYLFGIWLISFIFLMSVYFKSNSGVLGGTACICAISYFLSMIQRFTEYLPTYLFSAFNLLNGASKPENYYRAIGITAVSAVIAFIIAVAGFNRKIIQ